MDCFSLKTVFIPQVNCIRNELDPLASPHTLFFTSARAQPRLSRPFVVSLLYRRYDLGMSFSVSLQGSTDLLGVTLTPILRMTLDPFFISLVVFPAIFPPLL